MSYHRRPYITGQGRGFCVVIFVLTIYKILQIYQENLFYEKEDQGDG